MISYYYFTKLPEAKHAECISGRFSLNTIPNRILSVIKDKNFMRFVKFDAVWNFGQLMINIFMSVFMIKVLKLKYTEMALFLTPYFIANLLFTFFWGRIIDKHGCKPVLYICAMAIGITPLIWIFTIYSKWLLIPMYFFAGIFWAGLNLAFFNIKLKLAPAKERASYLSFDTIVTSVVSVIAPAVGGIILDVLENVRLDIGFMELNSYQILFFIGFFSRVLPVFLLNGVKEPKVKRTEKVFGIVMSTIGIGFMEGVGTIMSFVLTPFNALRYYVKHLAVKSRK